MLSVGTVVKFIKRPVSLSLSVMKYDVISPFWSSSKGACQDILTLVELTDTAATRRGGPAGAIVNRNMTLMVYS